MIRLFALAALIAAPALAQPVEDDTAAPAPSAASPQEAPPAETVPTDPAAVDPVETAPPTTLPDGAAPPSESTGEDAADPAPEPAFQTERVTLETENGPLVIAVEVERAPITAKNFLRYVREGRFNGMTLYRASNLGRGYGLVQGGTRGNPEMILPPITHEPTSQTGLSHTDGTVSMAMGEPGTADGDFFIIVGDLISLDAGDGQPGFAAFGHVEEGMDMVRALLDAPTDPNEGEGAMRGQMLAEPVKILSAETSE
ncbi:peptidylprolyl isomerase [Pacificimonas sp. ICDLI1SI03]